ncbi:hypothetical protein EJB05_44073, partial [Eragrostis curvula]
MSTQSATKNNSRSRWLGTEDGAGAWLLTTTDGGNGASPRLVDPFTGATTALPPFPETIAKYVSEGIDGVVCSDGTVFLYAIANYDKQMCYIVAAVLRPGDAEWTEGESRLVYNGFEDSCAAASHRGSILLVDLYQIHIVKLRVSGDGGDRGRGRVLFVESDTARSDRGIGLCIDTSNFMEIRERLLQPTSTEQGVRSGSIIRHGRTEYRPHFKIFVGNLPSWVDSIKLRQFFNNYVDVTDARVVRCTRTGRSWGYGFVTMATIEEPDEIFAALDGE